MGLFEAIFGDSDDDDRKPRSKACLFLWRPCRRYTEYEDEKEEKGFFESIFGDDNDDEDDDDDYDDYEDDDDDDDYDDHPRRRGRSW